MSSVNPENIPQELRAKKQWVCWRYEERDGKKTKVPIALMVGGPASSTNSMTWGDFECALRSYQEPSNNLDGIGFVFNNDFIGVDLDKAIDNRGEIKPWATEILKACNQTYAEITPSGKGFHIISKGALPEGWKGRGKAYHDGKVEIYSKGRYFTFTGNHLPGTPATAEDQSAAIIELYKKINGENGNGANRKSKSTVNGTDIRTDDCLEAALEDPVFSRLWYGDISQNNNDDSAADLALCNKIVFYFGPDPDVVDRLFRQSKLYREKWERNDYRKWTIDKAIEGTPEIYAPKRKTAKNGGASRQAESQNEPINEPEKKKSGELILDPGNPLPTARLFVDRFYTIDSTRGLQHQAGVFYEYQRAFNAYADLDESAIRSKLYEFLDSAKTKTESRLVPFKPTKTKVDNALDALRAITNLPMSSPSPSWLKPNTLDPLEIIACRNGLLHIPTRKLLPPTPEFFTLNGIHFEFNSNAPRPENWLRFLDQLWPDDSPSIQSVQEWIGYLLTPRTLFQKIFMIVGPKRSGKGTIARVIRMLLGERAFCGPTLANMAEPFGLAILINKSAAVIADARIGGRTDSAIITERLLSISGEDALSIPRKFLPDWNGKLSTRFMLLTNESKMRPARWLLGS
jgi:hypothetical protein